MWIKRLARWAVALAVAAMAGAAGAQEPVAFYTDLDLDACLVVEADDFGATWTCPGYRGFPLVVREGDLRFFVSYGLTPLAEPAMEQTLPPFNYLGPRIEWRVGMGPSGLVPRATILRWITEPAEADGLAGNVLVVTQIAPGATCHIAYVDARANPDANDLARAAADRLAGTVDCATTAPEIVGQFEAY